MADESGETLNTSGGVLKTTTGALGAIPIVGPILSAVGGIAGGVMQGVAANKQRQQAEQIRKAALMAQKAGLRPEYAAKLRLDQMLASSDQPGLDQYKKSQEQMLATHLRTIREASPNGAATVAAISAALANENQDMNRILAGNEAYKAGKMADVGNTLWNVGDKQRYLEDLRDQEKARGLTAASAFENAATANKMNAANTIIGSLTSAGSNMMSNMQQQENQDALTKMYNAYLMNEYKTGKTVPTSVANGLISTIQ